MKKFYYLKGKTEGGLWEMIQGQKHRGDQRVHLSASYSERDDLYRIYNFIDERVAKVVTTLSKYGAHKVVLLPDNIIDDLKIYTATLPSNVCWFFEKHPVYTDFELVLGSTKLIGRVVKTWYEPPHFVIPKYHISMVCDGVYDSMRIVGHPDDLVNTLLKILSKTADNYSTSDLMALISDLSNLKSAVSIMNNLLNDAEAEKMLKDWREKNEKKDLD